MAKVTLHMVQSLDGFIAKKDGDVKWMNAESHYEDGADLTQELIDEFYASVDCYVMGSKTYEQALELGWVYGYKPVIVCTNRVLPNNRETVSFYSGDLKELIEQKLAPQYEKIWMVGGVSMTKEFIQRELADEIVVSILPIILGDGILFFDYIGREIPLELRKVVPYKEGLVELCYGIGK